MKKQKFHLGDILSITTGRLLSPRHMDGVYDILNFMSQDNLFTHQLPRVAEECKPPLLKQHPYLAEVCTDNITKENWKQWLDEQVIKYGEYLEVETLPTGVHENIEPIKEAIDIKKAYYDNKKRK